MQTVTKTMYIVSDWGPSLNKTMKLPSMVFKSIVVFSFGVVE